MHPCNAPQGPHFVLPLQTTPSRGGLDNHRANISLAGRNLDGKDVQLVLLDVLMAPGEESGDMAVPALRSALPPGVARIAHAGDVHDVSALLKADGVLDDVVRSVLL